MTLQETIRPSADLRNHYSEISKLCKENKEAVIITVNGRGDTVTLSYEEYKNMKARIELLEVLAEAEDDVKNSREPRRLTLFLLAGISIAGNRGSCHFCFPVVEWRKTKPLKESRETSL